MLLALLPVHPTSASAGSHACECVAECKSFPASADVASPKAKLAQSGGPPKKQEPQLSSSGAPQEQVESYLKDLNEDDLKIRNEATIKLVMLWENEDVTRQVEILLEKARKEKNEEVMYRCDKILKAIEFRRSIGKKIVTIFGEKNLHELMEGGYLNSFVSKDPTVRLALFQDLAGLPRRRINERLNYEVINPDGLLDKIGSNFSKSDWLTLIDWFASGATDENLKINIILAIRYKNLHERVNIVLGFLNESEAVQKNAVTTLGIFRTKEAALKLIQLLGTSKGEMRRVIKEALESIGSKEINTELHKLLQHTDPLIIADALDLTGRLGITGLEKEILEILKGKKTNNSVYLGAIKAAGLLKIKDAVPEILKALDDYKYTSNIVTICHTIKELEIREAIPKLMDLLRNEKAQYPNRTEAAHTLAFFKHKECAAEIIKLLPNDTNGYSLVYSLYDLLGPKEGAKKLIELVEDNKIDSTARPGILTVIEFQAIKSALSTVLKCLKDTDQNIRLSAVKTLT